MAGLTVMELNTLRGEIRRKDTTSERLLEIAALDPQLSRLVAKESVTPASVLDKLAFCTDAVTRRAVAAHPNTSPETLSRLAHDKQVSVLKAVAANSQTPGAVLDHLSKHPKSAVRLALLEHRSLPHELLARLHQDPEPEIRSKSLIHPRRTSDAVRAALSDEASEVRARATHVLAALNLMTQADWEVLLHDPAVEVRLALAKRFTEHLPLERRADYAAKLLKDPSAEVREAVAPFASIEVLNMYVHDTSSEVRRQLALRTDSEEILEKLVLDTEEKVRAGLAYNKNTPRNLLSILALTVNKPYDLSFLFHHQNSDEEIRKAILENEEFIDFYKINLLTVRNILENSTKVSRVPPDIRQALMRRFYMDFPFEVAMQPDITAELFQCVAWTLDDDARLRYAGEYLEHETYILDGVPASRFVLERLALSPNALHAKKAREQLARLQGEITQDDS